MVKVAIAGPGRMLKPGTFLGRILLTSSIVEVAREIIDGLVATGKHEIIILSRRVRHG